MFRRDGECEQDDSESAHWYHCLPPVSPYRCRRQAVLDLLFDDVWQQLVGWMKELVQHQWECCTSGSSSDLVRPHRALCAVSEWCVWSAAGDRAAGSPNPVRDDSQDPLTLLSAVPAVVPRVGHSRVPPITAGLHVQVSRRCCTL